MGRKSKFTRSDMTRAALRLVAERGPGAATVAAVAKEVGAPTGSLYYRYRSRKQLLGELWMDLVERFQAGLVGGLAEARSVEDAVDATRLMLSWTRQHPMETRLLLLHRRQDFMPGAWPRDLIDRAAALEPELGAALRGFAQRFFGSARRDHLVRLRFALLDAPFGAIKPYVEAGKPIPPLVDELIAATVRAILGSSQREEKST
jgi:AcrR family transcriptional regulator